jgi:CMP-N-acetylneuraminic acid synthetase
VRYSTLVEKKSVIGDKVLPYPVTDPQIDIDTETDFAIAEFLLARRRSEENGSAA